MEQRVRMMVVHRSRPSMEEMEPNSKNASERFPAERIHAEVRNRRRRKRDVVTRRRFIRTTNAVIPSDSDFGQPRARDSRERPRARDFNMARLAIRDRDGGSPRGAAADFTAITDLFSLAYTLFILVFIFINIRINICS